MQHTKPHHTRFSRWYIQSSSLLTAPCWTPRNDRNPPATGRSGMGTPSCIRIGRLSACPALSCAYRTGTFHISDAHVMDAVASRASDGWYGYVPCVLDNVFSRRSSASRFKKKCSTNTTHPQTVQHKHTNPVQCIQVLAHDQRPAPHIGIRPVHCYTAVTVTRYAKAHSDIHMGGGGVV